MGLLGIRFAFYLSQQSLFQSLYKFLFVKRPRDSNDILIEPVDNQHWLCETHMIPTTPSSKISSFYFKKSPPASIYYSFHLKEKYSSSPFSYREKEIYDEGHFLWTYSIPVMTENTQKYLRVIKNTPFSSIYDIQKPKLSSLSFLDIQYHHPEMKDSLILEVPKEWCCVGNGLFSPAFVLRMLYYQTLPFIFDMRYSLDIMDNELNMLSLNSNQHIVLNEMTYEVL
jgi:hypothetical protein